MLEQAVMLARERDLLKDIDEHLRFAWQQLTRLLASGEPALALAEATRGTQRFPDHWPLVADLCALQLEHGDPRQALALYGQLVRGSPEEAQGIAERFVSGTLRIARSRLRERRVQEALELLDPAVELFPRRADVLMARAEALVAAGRVEEAAQAAALAASIDPALTQEAEAMRVMAQRARTPGVVQIPFDPQTNAVNAQVSVGGLALQFVVDTGATLTTVPSAIADQLQLRKAGTQRVKVNTASGIVEGDVVKLPSLQIGTLEIRNVQAVVLDLPENLAGKGLLGLNVLQLLNMEIDAQNGVLVLKQPPRQRQGR